MTIAKRLNQQTETVADPNCEALKQALDTSEAINEALFDLSPYPITITRIKDGRFMLVNQCYCKISGYSPDQVIGQTPQELKIYANPSDRSRMLELLQQNGCLDKFEAKFKTKDNRLIHANISGRAINYKGHDCLLSITTYVNKLSKAHQTIRETENRYRNILNSITESYYEVDLKGRFTFFNNAVVTLFGYSADELMGLGYQDYTTPEDAPKVYHAFSAVYREEVPVKYVEYAIRRKDGSTVQMEVSVSLLRDDTGKPVGFYGINRDRTEQKKAEEALRRSEEKYRTILEEMEEGYYETDLKGDLTYFNDAATKIHGYPAEELMGMSYRQYLTPEQAAKNFKIFSHIYKTGNPTRIADYEIIRKNGSVGYTEISAYPLRNHMGKTIGFWGITRDRTEQVQAEMALQKSEEQYRLLVENANEGIYINQQDRIKFHNLKTANITGYTADDLQNIDFSDLVHPEDKKNIYNLQQRKLEEGHTPDVFSFRILNQAKEILWVELSAIGINWEGKPATLNFLRDVTLQKKMETQLIQTQKMEAIGTLAGGIAHDFNNILGSMIGFTELVLEDMEPGTLLTDNLEEVLIAGQRAKDLVQQILAFARQSEEKVEPVIVGSIVKEALKLIRSSLPATIAIQSDIASNSLILGNATQVHQIIMNLCTNAAHAMEDSGGILKVDLTDVYIADADAKAHLDLAVGDYLELSVSDNGSGIPPEIIRNIFEPYFTTKGPGDGTGMGLSVVQGIVEKYGGRIMVDSKLDHGTTFTIYLPVSHQKKECNAAATKVLPSYSGRILLVDDELPLLKMGSQLLARMGYKVTTQSNSLEALELFGLQPDAFDLVITDMTMPDLTGDRLARKMMDIRSDIPVVLCTGFSKKVTEEMIEEMGVKALIYKPIVKEELSVALRKVLEN